MSITPVTLMIGTTKGLFLAKANGDRTDWSVTGPHCPDWSINHATSDPESGTLWAGGGGEWSGAGVWRSDDHGATWTVTRLTRGSMDDWAEQDPSVAEMFGITGDPLPFGDQYSAVWSLCATNGTLYAGTKPAGLLASADGGKTWTQNDAFQNFPERDGWNPGAAGLVLHTIVPDPSDREKLWLGVSAAGVFATEDGGKSWERRNRLSNAEACAGHDHPAAPANGETGHCVHNMMLAPRGRTGGDRLYQQNHHGVWRSDDGARSWENVTDGLPSTFGFPIRVHPRDPDTIWTIPLNGDMAGRFPPDAAAAVWKSSDGGQTWDAKRDGLPQTACYFTVLRQAMAGDTAEPVGLYFGTNSGSVFATRDEGDTWDEIVRHLPTILCVEAVCDQ